MRKPPASNGDIALNTPSANQKAAIPLMLLSIKVCAIHLENAGSRPTTVGLESAFSHVVSVWPPTDWAMALTTLPESTLATNSDQA